MADRIAMGADSIRHSSAGHNASRTWSIGYGSGSAYVRRARNTSAAQGKRPSFTYASSINILAYAVEGRGWAQDKLCRADQRPLSADTEEKEVARHSSVFGINRETQRRRPPCMACRRTRSHRGSSRSTSARVVAVELARTNHGNRCRRLSNLAASLTGWIPRRRAASI